MEEKINTKKRKSIKKTMAIAFLGVLSSLPFIKASPYLFRDGGVDALEISKDQVDVKGNKIVNLADPTLDQDAATKISTETSVTRLVSQTVGGSNGEAVYLSSSTTWSQADASADTTSDGMIAIRISATEVLTYGVYTTTGLTAGSTYYISETAGAITVTRPTTTGTIVRIIGYALSTTELFVDPDKSYVENA